MTIGQKIIALRNSMGISQEKLAELLGVSRQSISKWEMDHSVPQIDKILQISEIFSISCDDLLHDDLLHSLLRFLGFLLWLFLRFLFCLLRFFFLCLTLVVALLVMADYSGNSALLTEKCFAAIGTLFGYWHIPG